MWPGLILLCHKPANVGAKTLGSPPPQTPPRPLVGRGWGGGREVWHRGALMHHPPPPPTPPTGEGGVWWTGVQHLKRP
jgi:hypothetical protein